MSKEEKAKEEKPYLQDLFDHMHNEHGLILTQSEMLEILCICCKEYDTVQFELGEIERQNKDLSTQLTAYKEALRELVELAPVVIDPCVAETYFEALECRKKYIEVSRKAKTLIE